MFESLIEREPAEPNREARERLRRGLGVVLCTRQKDESLARLADQVETADAIRSTATQFDFRNRTIEEIRETRELLKNLHEKLQGVALSFHGESPKIDENTFAIKNVDRIREEMGLARSLDGEAYTVHPPSVAEGRFLVSPTEVQEKVLQSYGELFVPELRASVENGKDFSIAIENMPVRGSEGSFGQRAEDILRLIECAERALVESGVNQEAARARVGATLDVNHALHSLEYDEISDALRSWFETLRERIKVVHLYMPSEFNADLQNKYEVALSLASEFSPDARILIESKRDAVVTKQIYLETKKVL